MGPSTPDLTTSSPGIPGGFIALMVFVFLIGIGVSIWKFSVAKQGAEALGVDPSTATQVALLDPNSTLVAGNLGAAAIARMKDSDGTDVADSSRDLNQRLADVDEAHQAGRLTDDEYAAVRKRILDTY